MSEEARLRHSDYSVKQQVWENGFPLDLYEPGNHGKIIGDYGLLAKTLLDDNKVSEGHYLELMKVLQR